MTLLLGVDGGATKTVAVVADASGSVLGSGRNGSSDIHAEQDPAVAIDRVAAAVMTATQAAGIAASELDEATFSLCGADWPEDIELYADGLAGRLGLSRRPTVVNDAIGALRAGTPDGVGVSLVMGTGGAIGAQGPDGRSWFSGMRLEPSGSVEFGRQAYGLLVRGEYGAGPVPGFRAAALAAFGVDSVEALVHAVTARGGLGERSLARLGPVLLEADHLDDPQAAASVGAHAELLAGYVRAAAQRVGSTEGDVTLVVAGGVLRHHCTNLVDGIARALPDYRIVRATVEPVFGALLLAADQAGVRPSLDRMRDSGPGGAFFETL